MEEDVFTISITVSQPAAKIDGTVEIVDDYGLSIVASQQGVELEGVAMSEISQTALIAFGQWYKGDPGQDGQDGGDGFSPVVTVTPTENGHEVTITDASGDHTFDVNDGVGVPQTLSLAGNELTLSDGGGTVTLPDGLPSQTGNNGKFLKTNGTTASWETVNEARERFECLFTIREGSGESRYDITCDKTVTEIADAVNSGDEIDATLRIYIDENEYVDCVCPFVEYVNGIYFFSGYAWVLIGYTYFLLAAGREDNQDLFDFENLFSSNDVNKLQTLSTVATSGNYNDLSDKPTLGTAAALDVATSGNASTTQVVKGDDTRLSDSRNAADVYSWAKAATKPTYTASEVGAIPTTDKGVANGVAELGSDGKVPSSQLPAYVDDVLEYASQSAFPATGESGKIYVALDTNKTYRWSGSAYVEISESLALGETSSTAYAGNKGKANADAISAIKDGTSIDSFGDVETALGNKQDTIDSSHKLNADYIEDGTTNKVINVKPDWNAASGNAAEILNKPTIPDAVSGTNDGTNWTTITIGSVTKNIPSGGGGSSTLAGLTDVDVSNPSEGQVLTYDNANSEWKNTTQYAAVLRTWTNS